MSASRTSAPIALAGLTLILLVAPPHAQQISPGFQTPPAPFPFPYHMALSPDAADIVTWVASGREIALWVRSLESGNAHVIAGSDSVRNASSGFPFWSPDGRFIAFFSNGKLKKTDMLGGLPVVLCDAPAGHGGAWNRDGVIVFAPAGNGVLFWVPAAGGVAQPLTSLDQSRQETAHRHPYFLPDGRRFLYVAISSRAEHSGIWVGSLDSPNRTFLVRASVKATFAPPDVLLFMRERTLLAQHLDLTRLTLSGDPFPVGQKVGINTGNAAAGFSTSETGTLAYSADGSSIALSRQWAMR